MPDKNPDKADSASKDDTAAKGPPSPSLEGGQSSTGGATQSGPMTWSSSGLGEGTPPPPPPSGLDALKARLGADIDHYGLELARRVLGELHIASLGGTPASPLAQEAASQLESGDASWWNDNGRAQAEREFSDLNSRGSLGTGLGEPAP